VTDLSDRVLYEPKARFDAEFGAKGTFPKAPFQASSGL